MHVINFAVSCLNSFMISKCLYNLFLAIKQAGRISLAGFNDLLCHTCEVVFLTFLK